MISAKTNAQTGNSVFQISMEITPNANMITCNKKERINQPRSFHPIKCISETLTKYAEIPPLRDRLVNAHQPRMNVGLFVQ